jgi:hypothetical protein
LLKHCCLSPRPCAPVPCVLLQDTVGHLKSRLEGVTGLAVNKQKLDRDGVGFLRGSPPTHTHTHFHIQTPHSHAHAQEHTRSRSTENYVPLLLCILQDTVGHLKSRLEGFTGLAVNKQKLHCLTCILCCLPPLPTHTCTYPRNRVAEALLVALILFPSRCFFFAGHCWSPQVPSGRCHRAGCQQTEAAP